MTVGDDDRSAILRRRAFFVTSAMAALGACATQRTADSKEPSPPPATATVSVPRAPPDAGEPEVDAALPERDAALATGDVQPPLVIPAGVSDTARAKYERLVSTMTRAYALLDDIERWMPSCNILMPKCEPAFRRVAGQLHELDGMFQRMFVCHGSSEEAKTYGELERAHEQHYQKRRRVVLERIEASLAPHGDPARARWEKARQDAFSAAPHPCLKFGCPDW